MTPLEEVRARLAAEMRTLEENALSIRERYEHERNALLARAQRVRGELAEIDAYLAWKAEQE